MVGCGQYRRNPAATSIWWLLLSIVTVHMSAAIKSSSSDSSFSVVSYLPEVRMNGGTLGRSCYVRDGVH
jgi:CRISPR/Cas system-associated exonuclease Cas4 (RecB family)